MRLCRLVVPGSLRHPARWAALAVGAGGPLLAFPAPALSGGAWFGLVPGLLVIRRSPSAREAAVRGWWLGCGYIVAAMYWLWPEMPPAGVLGAVVLGVLQAPFGWAAWALLRPPLTTARALAGLVVVPSCWLLAEWGGSWQARGGPWAGLGARPWP